MKYVGMFVILFFLFALNSCTKKEKSEMGMNDLYAWCIVPFDAQKRTPQERIDMLKRLGFNKYAYDWRVEHLDGMADEINIAQNTGIEIIAVWMWIDNDWDNVGALNPPNERIFKILAETGLKTQIWVSFHPNYFEGLTDDQAVEKGAEMIGYLSSRAKETGCKVGLYNHGDWFGEPANQIKIFEELPDHELGLVYNFHHAHEQLDDYSANVDRMMPYLWHVNINGMRREGPKIIPVGKGVLEENMIKLLIDKGYKGPFGILGHVEDADVEQILKNNLNGFFHLKL